MAPYNSGSAIFLDKEEKKIQSGGCPRLGWAASGLPLPAWQILGLEGLKKRSQH